MMHSVIMLLMALLELFGVGLVVLGILFLCCPFAIVYQVDSLGQKTKIGYLWRIKGDYILYQSMLPIFPSSRIGFVKGHEIRPLVTNIQQNKVQKTIGTFTDDGRIHDLNGAEVGICENPDQRSTYVVDENGERTGFVRGSFLAKKDLIVRAAGFSVLREEGQEDYEVFDVRVGFMDLMLPSTMIYMILFYPLMLLSRYLTDGALNNYMLLMLVWYVLIVSALYILKYEKTMRNSSIVYFVGLIDHNNGVKVWNFCIIVSSFLAFRIAEYSMYPLFAVILIGFICNLSCFNDKWVLEEPSSGWSERIPVMPATKPTPNSANTVKREFQWKPVLSLKGITSDDTVELMFTETDFNGPESTVRKANPFSKGPIQSDDDLCSRAKDVLNGVKTSDNCEETAIVKILNSAYRLTLQYGLADYELFDLLLGFVQSNVTYKLDDQCSSIDNILEYFRFACETLYDKEGDCDCKAILAYQLFKKLGVDVDLVEVVSGDAEYRNHVAIVLHNTPDAKVPLPPDYVEYAPGRGVYCEATGFGFKIGDIPNDIDVKTIKVIS